MGKRVDKYQDMHKFSALARQQKVGRPYHLINCMAEDSREEIAKHLGITLRKTFPLRDSWRGQLAQAQAWQLINEDRKGLQARASSYLRTLNILSRNPNWHEIVASACKHLRINHKAYHAKTLEKRLFDHLVEKALSKMDQQELAGVKKFINKEKEFVNKLREVGLSSRAIEFVIAATGRLAQKGGFKTYIGAVKLAAKINKRLGTKIVMKNVTKRLAVCLRALNVAFNILLVHDFLDLLFGKSDKKNVPVITQVYLFDTLQKL